MKSLTLLLLLIVSIDAFTQDKIEIEVQTGHLKAISKIAITPDGTRLVTSSADNKIILWDYNSNLQINSWSLDMGTYVGAATDLSFDHSGKILAAASKWAVAFIDITTGDFISSYTFTEEREGGQIQMSADGNIAYIITNRATFYLNHPKYAELIVLDIKTGKEIKKWKIADQHVRSAVLSSDETKLFFGYDESKKYYCGIWSISEAKVTSRWPTINYVYDAKFLSSDNQVIVAVGQVNSSRTEVIVYDLMGKVIKNLSNSSIKKQIKCVDVSRDGKHAIAGDAGGTLYVWDISTGESINRKSMKGSIRDVHFSSDGKYFYVARGKVSIFDDEITSLMMYPLKGGDEVRTFDNRVLNPNAAAINSFKRELLVSHNSGGVFLWDLEKAKVVEVFDSSEKTTCVASGENGLMAYSTEKFIKVIKDRKVSKIINLDLNYGGRFTMSKNGKVLGSTTKKKECKLFLADGSEKTIVPTQHDGDLSLEDMTLSPDGEYMAIAYRHKKTSAGWGTRKYKVDIFKINTQEFISSFSSKNPLSFSAISPDDKYIIIGSETADAEHPAIYDLMTGNKVLDLEYSDKTEAMRSAIFDQNSSKVYTVHLSGLVAKWDVLTGKRENMVQAHAGSTVSVDRYNDKYLITSGEDGQTKFWNLENLEPVASFLGQKGGEYAVITPNNNYLVSKTGVNSIAFNLDMNAYPCSQFDAKYNRPDKVIQSIGLSDPATINLYKLAYLKRLKRLGLNEKLVNSDIESLPTVELKNNISLSTTDTIVPLQISINDDLARLEKLHIKVNGVSVYGKKGIPLETGLTNISKEIVLPLQSGNNKISFSAQNENGTLSLENTQNIVCTAPKQKSDLYVLAIGVSKFKDSSMNLTYAAKDALDLSKYFSSSELGKFKTVYTKTITDQEVTKENVIKAKEFFERSNHNDVVILHVASHGLLDDEYNYFLATTDINFNDPKARGLSYDEFENLVDGIAARKKIVFIDACHSGEIDKDDLETTVASTTTQGNVKFRGFKTVRVKSSVGSSNVFEVMQELFADFRSGTGATVISSASGVEFAFESDAWKNGVFTYAVLEGLNSGKCDTNRDKEVQISELKNYVFDRVSELTHGKQHPTSRRENLEFDFVVW